MRNNKENLKKLLNLELKPIAFSNHRGYVYMGRYKKLNINSKEIPKHIKKLEFKMNQAKSDMDKYTYAIAISLLQNRNDEVKENGKNYKKN